MDDFENAEQERSLDGESFDFAELETRLTADLDAELSDLEWLKEDREMIGNPDSLGSVVLDVVWDQFPRLMIDRHSSPPIFSIYIASQCFREFFQQFLGNFLPVADDTVIGVFKNRCVRICVNGDNPLGFFHPCQVLNRAGDSEGHAAFEKTFGTFP